MEITQAQFEQIAHCLPTQRGNVSLSNLSVLNAVLYVAEHGCKWRGLRSAAPPPLQGATPTAWQSQFRGVCWKGSSPLRGMDCLSL